MKKQLILVTISAAALAVSVDSYAMMRRAPTRAAAPRAAQPVRNLPRSQKVPKRLHSEKPTEKEVRDFWTISEYARKKSEWELDSSDVCFNEQERHNVFQKRCRAKEIESLSNLSHELAKNMSASDAIYEHIRYYYNATYVTLPFPVKRLRSLDMSNLLMFAAHNMIKKCQRNAEEELAELVREQKRAGKFRIPDDIQ